MIPPEFWCIYSTIACITHLFFLLKEEIENPQESQPKEEVEEARTRSSPPRKIKTMTILLTVGKKLIENPNTHATVIGLIWACIEFR